MRVRRLGLVLVLGIEDGEDTVEKFGSREDKFGHRNGVTPSYLEMLYLPIKTKVSLDHVVIRKAQGKR